jgi:hypothetical protein
VLLGGFSDYSTSMGCGETPDRLSYTRKSVTKKRKKKAFRAVTAVKALARERIGAPRPAQVVQNRKKKQKGEEKHKPTLGELMQADD